MRTTLTTARWRGGASVAALAGLLCGCAASTTSPVAPAATTSGADPAAADHPVTITDVCGQDVEVVAPPERALALEQGATEVMLSLGLQERMAGTSYLTDPVLPQLAEAYASVPVLAPMYPAPEVVRSAEPDFVYSMLSSAFTADVAGTREELADLGVPAYVTRMNCEDPALTTDFTFDGFFQEITDIGAAFGVPERAEQLVADQRAALEGATRQAAAVPGDPTVMWFYSTYDGAPVVAGPGGVPAEITELVGATGAFDDLGSTWNEVTWEAIAERDPDVIVIADLTRGLAGDSEADKRELLATHPVASQLRAVQQERVVALPGSALDPSVRSAAAVGVLAETLTDQGLGS